MNNQHPKLDQAIPVRTTLTIATAQSPESHTACPKNLPWPPLLRVPLPSPNESCVHCCKPAPLPLAPRPSPLAPQPSPLTPRSSPLAPLPSRSRLATRPLLLSHLDRPSPLPSLLAPRSSLLAPCPSPLTPHSSPLAPHPSPISMHPWVPVFLGYIPQPSFKMGGGTSHRMVHPAGGSP